MKPGAGQSARGACSRGAPGAGKVINLDALYPPPWRSAGCVEITARAVSVPVQLHVAQPSDAAEARILIRRLATVPSRQAACGTVNGHFPALGGCLRVCRAGSGSTSGQKATWPVSCLGGLYHGARHRPARHCL